jgi:S-adenosylmethionine:tRNA ribosyltransferase-isomerase
MDRSEFAYELPAELIAQAPRDRRADSRLLVLDGASGAHEDRRFDELPELLRPGDLLVCNDTRVVPARLAGRKTTGGRVELLLERVTGERAGRFQIRASRSPRPGSSIELDGGAVARVVTREGDFFDLELECDVVEYLSAHGEVPLPPYIERQADANDAERYQTVFARAPGAVAAPTAGLHFDEALLEHLEASGIGCAFLTLHVGAGTFAPVRTEDVEAHRLHAERVQVSQALCARIAAVKRAGGRIIAVGTTVVRALETAADGRELAAYDGETRLFIYPGFTFRVTDGIVTNFHLPESSLLMLVAAFAGRAETLAAYRHAVESRYRFFSYGDAMLVWPRDRSRCATS